MSPCNALTISACCLPPDETRLQVSFPRLAESGARFLKELNDPAILTMAFLSLTLSPHSIRFGDMAILKGAETIEHPNAAPLPV